ncbi:MAG: tetratricopeptide repeat protein [Candidatus Heimdallarchaeota archaeon]|nr:tetratricopeptide repeat protein [Candidatus Heimdallarchaeota archaeon]
MELGEVKELWYHGNNREALKLLDSLTPQDQLEGKIIKSLILFQFGSINSAFELSEIALKEAREANNKEIIFIASVAYAWLISFQGRFRNASILLAETENLWTLMQSEESDNNSDANKIQDDELLLWFGVLNFVRGFCANFMGDHKTSVERVLKGLEITKNVGNKWFIAVSYYYQTWIHIFNNNLDQAKNSLDLSIGLFQQLGNKTWESFATNISSILSNKNNNLSEAINYSVLSLEMSEKEENFWGVIFASYWLWEHYRKIGKISQVLLYFTEKMKQYSDMDFKWGQLAILPRIASIHVSLGEIDLAIQQYNDKITLERIIGHELDQVWSYQRIANLYGEKGKFESAFKHYNNALQISIKYDRIDLISETLFLLGKSNYQFGNLEVSINFLNQSLKYLNEIGDQWKIGEVHLLIGENYLGNGQLSLALDSFAKSIEMYENMDATIFPSNRKNWSLALLSMGKIHQHEKEFDKSEEYLKRSLEYFRETNDQVIISKILYHLISLMIESDDINSASEYLKELESYSRSQNHPHIRMYYRISKAIMLKNSPRMREKSQAQDIYQDIIEEDVILFDITVIALIDLSELLIAELKSFGEAEVMEEIKRISSKLFKLASEKNASNLIIEGFILQFKLALLDFNFDVAQNLLQKAIKMVTIQGNEKALTVVNAIQKDFLNQLNQWKKFAKQNLGYEERLKHLEIEDYLSNIYKFIPSDLREMSQDN